MLITLSGKKRALNKVCALNKQVFKYVIMAFFSSKISILSLVLASVLPCMHFTHLPLLDHSTPAYISRALTIKIWHALYVAEESCTR